MTEAAIALGSNLGDRRVTLEHAVAQIDASIGQVQARSPWIETPALIHPDDPATEHPAFLNGVIIVRSMLDPERILAQLLMIEQALGRQRIEGAPPWQPRPIDLDLIYVGDRVVRSELLVLPHPRMHARDFVLRPLATIRPDWRHPLEDRTVAEMLADLSGR